MKSVQGTVVTVGTFDGVHLGHQAILREVQTISRNEGLEAIAYTFPFPPRIGNPGPHLILTQTMKSVLLRRYVARVVSEEFPRVHDLSPQEFVKRVLLDELGARVIVVGENFRFGRERAGDPNSLKELGAAHGLSVTIVPSMIVGGAPVSSTRIRTLIREGKVAAAERLLGRPPIVSGRVVPGDRIGSRIGYPTANLDLPSDLIRPGTGIYLGYAFWNEGEGAGLLYIGYRPTLSGKEMRFELYLLSPPSDDLTGKTLEVHLLSRLRDDRAFPSLSALKDQIAADIATAHELLSSRLRPAPILFAA